MINLYQKVTDSILLQLRNGTMPWIRPWSASAGRNTPANAITGRLYSGINTLLLWSAINHGFTVPRFLTFRQCNAAGGKITKGQNGFKVYFVKQLEFKKAEESQDTDDTTKRVTLLREYTVFNVAQCENLPDDIVNPKPSKVHNKDQRLELADEFVHSLEADLRHGSGEAYYSPGHDFITVPDWTAFSSAEAYYNVLFHEHVHWTGHKSRLDRDLKGRFGDHSYAAEELVAELGASFLCSEFGFDTTPRSSSYIKTWIKLFENDNRAIFTAASKAQKAADWMRQKALQCSTPLSPSKTSLDTPLPIPERSFSDTSTRSTGLVSASPVLN